MLCLQIDSRKQMSARSDFGGRCARHGEGTDLVGWQFTLRWSDGAVFPAPAECRTCPQAACLTNPHTRVGERIFFPFALSFQSHILKILKRTSFGCCVRGVAEVEGRSGCCQCCSGGLCPPFPGSQSQPLCCQQDSAAPSPGLAAAYRQLWNWLFWL